MNIKKLSSFLFQRSVIVAVLIILQATVLLVPMIWAWSYYVYVYWACVVLSLLAVLVIVRRQTDPGYKIAWNCGNTVRGILRCDSREIVISSSHMCCSLSVARARVEEHARDGGKIKVICVASY